MPRTNYICPRCGYQTIQKNSMRDHLVKRKKACPPLKNDIELNEDIKQSILDNHIYNIPVVANPMTIINQQINHYNQMNNFISQMDPLQKLNSYLKHTNKQLIGLDDHINNVFESELEALDRDDVITYLDKRALLSVVDTVTTIDNIDSLNVLYDNIANKIKIYNEGSWKSCLLDAGVHEVIACIKDSYLDSYECHLIRKWSNTSNAFKKNCIREYIEEYYKFLVALDMTPFVIDKEDGDILGTDDKNYYLEETWYPRFKAIKDNMKISDIKRIKGEIIEVIKGNTKSTVLELNKIIMELINVDEPFKNEVLKHIKTILESSDLC